MTAPVSIAVAGAGLIGKRHVSLIIAAEPHIKLAAIVDPSAEGKRYAESLGRKWYPSLRDLFGSSKPDGVIVATPSQLHVENGLECVAVGCPMLIEKPLATSSLEADKLIDAARKKNVPILVGHYRRHNPVIQQAHALISAGLLGNVTVVHSTCWMGKPKDYFSVEWRRQPGAGPLTTNAIHDIDLLRYLCGDVVAVQAMCSNATRGFPNADTAVSLLKFASGALGTLSVSDTVPSPWSWETTTGENVEFATTQESCYLIGGTRASLSVPDLRIWHHEEGKGHWKSPISATYYHRDYRDPLAGQIAHFANVIRGLEAPLVSGEEGVKALRVIEAVQQSAAAHGALTGIPVAR